MNKDGSYGLLLILAAAILWGTTGTSQALAPPGAHPLTVGALRLAVGGGGLLLLALFRGKITRSCFRHPAITLLSALLVASYQLAFFAAVTISRSCRRHDGGNREWPSLCRFVLCIDT